VHGERRGIRKVSLAGYALIATLFPRKDDLAHKRYIKETFTKETGKKSVLLQQTNHKIINI
jgi:hypothetical protein